MGTESAVARRVRRLVAALPLIAAGLAGCDGVPRPDLLRLYQVNMDNAEAAAPVILIPGVFGSRLRDRVSGKEVWPGSWPRILFSSYPELALEIDPQTQQPRESRLEAYGIAEQALGRDFYRPILETLTRYGGYSRGELGTSAKRGERRYYVFAYDWRQDNVRSARELHRLIEAVQRDYGDPALRVDIVAHSMGGLIARYYLRFGTLDVLDGTPAQVTMEGAARVRKLILLGTPNLGSVSSLHAFLSGESVGLTRISPRTLATMPSGYQLFPHPLASWLVDIDGKPRDDDLFSPETWQRHRWSIYDPALVDVADAAALRRYFAHQLERARRFAWMLSVAEPVSPIRYVLFGGDCHLTPARLLIEHVDGRDRARLAPSEVRAPRPGVRYDDVMLEPGDGRVTKPSLLARETLDPSAPQHEDSFLPLAYAFFLCEHHNFLTNNINFQDNLLNVLLTRHLPWESSRADKP
ncbi:lipase/acyltransferase domain-containing protein [Piscinibacter sp.]|uniref:lipase/acyltransferase domain-containing protein n=1 Tax=Piscinibacter sp. TaxID=1903157 RepID=UPI002F414839